MVVGPNDPEIQNIAAQMQKTQQVQQMTNTMVLSTAQMIFSHVIGEMMIHAEEMPTEAVRNIAKVSRELAPYLVEAFGLVTIKEQGEIDGS